MWNFFFGHCFPISKRASLCFKVPNLRARALFRCFRKIAKGLLWSSLAPIGQNFMKFEIWEFFENMSRKFKFHYNLMRITRTLHENQYTFLIISRSVILRIKNVSDKSCREIITQILCSIVFFFLKKCHVWDKVETYCGAGKTQITMWLMRIACYKHTLKYVIFVVLLLQKWLNEAPQFRCTRAFLAFLNSSIEMNVMLYTLCIKCHFDPS